jgi:predicted alpha/beta-hydrolase family hydrolase
MRGIEEFVDGSNSDEFVRGFLHRPTSPDGDGVILTHGAGANCQTLLLTTLADAFCAAGLTALRCDLPFRQLRPHGPPSPGSAERDQNGLRAAVASMRSLVKGKILLGGHSYGGRQASLLAASEPDVVDRLLLLSFPLHPPQRPQELRSKHFPSLQTPAFFVHGTRDGFGSAEEMEAALRLIPAPTKLILVTGAGHELMSSRNRQDVTRKVVPAFLSFAQRTTSGARKIHQSAHRQTR